MNNDSILRMQSSRNVATKSESNEYKTREVVVEECRKIVRDYMSTFASDDPVVRRNRAEDKIKEYVMNYRPYVKGYVDANTKVVDTGKLVSMLVDEILDRGILTQAMRDPTINEIRINGREIKVEKNGKSTDLLDENGEIVRFTSVEQQEIVFRKLLSDSDVRLTPSQKIINARTIEGYRIAAIHYTALSKDTDENSEDNGYSAAVIRKFKKSKLTLNQLAQFGTLSDNMARFLRILPVGKITFVTVGPTASGKTTLNNAILKEVPSDMRVILNQNPSEIDIRRKDSSGHIVNDVLHVEAEDIINPTVYDNTMENVMAADLRISPEIVVLGEIRKNKEFEEGMNIMLAGHPINATYHAMDSYSAITRYLSAYASATGEPTNLALKKLTNALQIIIVQKLLRDGTRKVLELTEVLGADGTEPIINVLYKYEADGRVDYEDAEKTKVKKIYGSHKRVGKISKEMESRFRLEAIPKEDYDFITREPRDDELETYSGRV